MSMEILHPQEIKYRAETIGEPYLSAWIEMERSAAEFRANNAKYLKKYMAMVDRAFDA